MDAVVFHNVTKNRKGFAIENLNIAIPQGYLTGFIGPNGSGKTTVIQMMMDILQIDKGDITLFGSSHKEHNLKQKIGFVYDDLYFYEDFTIKKMKSFIAPLYLTWNDELFQKYLIKFDLPLHKKLKHFSKGMKMKCALLFALAHEPEFLVMDEPTSGLDPIFRRELLQLLQEIMVHENQTIFLSTHITTDLDRIADYIIFIYQGKIVFQKSIEEINEGFHIIKGKNEISHTNLTESLVGIQETELGWSGLFEGCLSDGAFLQEKEIIVEKATLEDIMYYMTREGK